MSRCPNCSYKLVLLSSRPKYKCALCSKLFFKKEIEVKEFYEFNKRRRIEDIKSYEKERKEHLIRIKEIKNDLKLLFNGFSKTPKEYRKEYYEKNKEKIKQLNKEWRLKNREYDLKRKQEYSKKNRELINAKAILRRKNNPELERQSKKLWRDNNLDHMRTYGMIQHYRRKQKALALQHLQNDTYRPSNKEIFHSVPTFALSYLLFS
jgi:DNA-directed RNA polymerase subunit RPC12/RpoP|tara:strand:+ start:275 stop:895 length:621 start_codon:yes stop_codon:yes gene_type:complete